MRLRPTERIEQAEAGQLEECSGPRQNTAPVPERAKRPHKPVCPRIQNDRYLKSRRQVREQRRLLHLDRRIGSSCKPATDSIGKGRVFLIGTEAEYAPSQLAGTGRNELHIVADLAEQPFRFLPPLQRRRDEIEREPFPEKANHVEHPDRTAARPGRWRIGG